MEDLIFESIIIAFGLGAIGGGLRSIGNGIRDLAAAIRGENRKEKDEDDEN